MGYRKVVFRSSYIGGVPLLEGEPIEHKVSRILEAGESIKDGAPEIFTEKKDGVISAYDIRTDRWEIACEAMDKVHMVNAAKREEKGRVIEMDTNEDSKSGDVGEANS